MVHRRKKLVYVVTKASWGGAQKYVFDLANHFKDTYSVEIWCGKNEFEAEISLISLAEQSGITVRYIDSLSRDINIRNEFKAMVRLYKLIQEHKPDILHLNSTKAVGLGGLIGRFSRVPKMVFTAHGLAIFEDRRQLQKTLIDIYSRCTFLLMHNIILISQKEFSYTKSWFGARKHSLVRNGLSPKDQKPLKEILSKQPKKVKIALSNTNCVRLVGIGELHKNKGITHALEAFRQLKEAGYNFNYFHFGEGELEKSLIKQAEEAGLNEYVFFLGFEPNAAAYLANFDALVFPSIKEGLPYVILEAGFAGIPVFASTVGGIPEIVMDYETGRLHEPKDSEMLTKQLMEFLKLNKYDKPKIFKKTTHKFSFKFMVNKTQKIYESS